MLILTFFSCSEKREYRDLLSDAAGIMDKNPDSALVILSLLGTHESEFSDYFKMRYQLQLISFIPPTERCGSL